jgi:exodeoxyribonuclease III
MKVATFNVNNINKRLPNLLAWLKAAVPDVVCLQELKATDAEFSHAAIRRAGYDAIWGGQKTWNGELPRDPSDTQSRYIEAAVNGVVIGWCLYLPNATRSLARNSIIGWRGSSGWCAMQERSCGQKCR